MVQGQTLEEPPNSTGEYSAENQLRTTRCFLPVRYFVVVFCLLERFVIVFCLLDILFTLFCMGYLNVELSWHFPFAFKLWEVDGDDKYIL